MEQPCVRWGFGVVRKGGDRRGENVPGWMPCSRQYSSQQALPTWIPAWPMWMEMTSRMVGELKRVGEGSTGAVRSDCGDF
jgi:hypothetical protein